MSTEPKPSTPAPAAPTRYQTTENEARTVPKPAPAPEKDGSK